MITAASWCRQPHSINVDDRLTHTAQLEGCGNGVRVEPVRHRQTKEAATDMFDLQPPRHISVSKCFPSYNSKADIARYGRHVSNVPIADIGQGRSKNDGISFSPYEGPPRTSASSGVNHLSLRNRGTRCLGRQTFCGRFPAFRP